MTIKIGINGFGRMGRLSMRAALIGTILRLFTLMTLRVTLKRWRIY